MLTRFRWAVILILMAIAVFLNVRNWSLNRKLESLTTGNWLEKGMRIERLSVQAVEQPGNQPVHRFESFQSDRSQLLFVLSPTCRFCRTNLANWQSIENQIDHSRFRLLALSIEDHPELALYRQALQTPVLVLDDFEPTSSNRLTTTPQTVLLDSSGRVIRNWVGDLSNFSQEVEKKLQARLQ